MNESLPKRKRIKLPETVYKQGHVFSITICTKARESIFRHHPKLADRCAELLISLAKPREAGLFAWCIMPDHVHVLIQDEDLAGFVRLFKGRASKEARQIYIHAPLWQRGFYDHALRDEERLLDVARYIWANPVRAGLAASPEMYPWSGSLVWPEWREEYRETEDGRG